MDNGVKDRTIKFVKYKGITMKSFEAKCGLSSGYITSMRKGFGANKLNNVLIAFPELNRDWLLYGEGEMLKSGQDGVQKEVPARKPQEVYLLPVSAQAGSLNDFIASVYAGQCDSILSPIAGAELALTVAGDSMTPEYPNGSIIFIKRINERAFINWGKVYVLDTCNGTVIKRLVPAENNDRNKVRCLSINPDPIYAPFEIDLNDVYGIYKVLLCMSIK